MKDNQKLIEWVIKHNHGICAGTNINSSKLKQFNGRVFLLTTTGQSEELDVDNIYWEKCSDGFHNFWVYATARIAACNTYIAPCYACNVPLTILHILEKEQLDGLLSNKIAKQAQSTTVEAYDRAMKPLRNM